ncbi:MAG: HlyC/CorC family transporter, partial [Lachnospiraceae bacterium]|nr:HlyC/CorC family transporter [Lachnospiraceae bacterium]
MMQPLILLIILIFLNAAFASAEIAVISMKDARLKKLTEEGNSKAIKLTALTKQPARFLATIQVAITLASLLQSAFAAENFAGPLVSVLVKAGVTIPESVLRSVCVVVITLILAYFNLVFGELVPKRVAMKKAESLGLSISGLVAGISTIFKPIVWFLTVSTNGVLRLMGIDPNEADEQVNEEEILMMVDAGSEKGAIDQQEKEFIQNVFEFDDLTAKEIAVHRTEVTILWMEDPMAEWAKTIHDSRHTLYPVCEGSPDNIIGILNAKDYFRLDHKSRENVMQDAVKAP